MHESWKKVLEEELQKPYVKALQVFVTAEYDHCICYPKAENIFRAYAETPFDTIKVVILGQDPYHGPNEAIGLSFGIDSECKKVPPSLLNIEKELKAEYGNGAFDRSMLEWAQQGVFMLNSVLTVRQGGPASHAGRGWETFTNATIRAISQKESPVVFMLWGKFAESKTELIESVGRHCILTTTHPSPLAARRGFAGSNCFKAANEFLKNKGMEEIKWLKTG